MIVIIKLLPAIAIIQLLSNHFVIETDARLSDLKQYKPVAMDESWTVLDDDKPNIINDRAISLQDSDTSEKLVPFVDTAIQRSSSLGVDYRGKYRDGFEKPKGQILEFNDWPFPELVPNNLFKVPKAELPHMTRMLKKNPVFVREEGVPPELTRDAKGKVIASYKFIVPIYLPAVQTVSTAKKRAPTKLVKSTVTEMVPVTQNIPHVKEIIKAVKIPQKVITDFVETKGKSIPSQVDDKVRPGEKVISTVVKDYD